MKIALQVERFIPAASELVFDLAAGPEHLASLFAGAGPVPAIVRAEMVDSAPVAAGSTIRFEDATGAIAYHHIDKRERPLTYEYDLHGLGRPFSLLVRIGYARWSFSPERGGTRVRWRYDFELTSPLAYPAASLVLQLFFRRAMQRCLEALDALASKA